MGITNRTVSRMASLVLAIFVSVPVVAQQDYNVNQTLMTLANSINPKWMEEVYQDPETGDEINPARFRNRTNMYFTMKNRFEKTGKAEGRVALRNFVRYSVVCVTHNRISIY